MFGKKSAAKKRVPICPICNSKDYMEISAGFLSAVIFRCTNPACVEHAESVGEKDRWIAPAPENSGKAPNCPKCGHNKYIGQSYSHGLYLCNKHKHDGSIKNGKFDSNDSFATLVHG